MALVVEGGLRREWRHSHPPGTAASPTPHHNQTASSSSYKTILQLFPFQSEQGTMQLQICSPFCTVLQDLKVAMCLCWLHSALKK